MELSPIKGIINQLRVLYFILYTVGVGTII